MLFLVWGHIPTITDWGEGSLLEAEHPVRVSGSLGAPARECGLKADYAGIVRLWSPLQVSDRITCDRLKGYRNCHARIIDTDFGEQWDRTVRRVLRTG